MFCCIFSAIGVATVSYFLYQIFRPILFFYILKHFLSERKNLKLAGDWAVVTGATDGIGKAFAENLASDGLNIFLISRSIEKLQSVAREIESAHKVETKIFVADFQKVDFYDNLKKEIDALSSVSCLVNNVGVSYPIADRLDTGKDLSVEFLHGLVTCNSSSMACMSRITLSKLLENPPATGIHRYIINVGSLSGVFPTPYLSVYSASKMFVKTFSSSLEEEMRGTCVRVHLIYPGFVHSKMTNYKKISYNCPLPDAYVNSALDMLGVLSSSCGYFAHSFNLSFIMMVPEWLRTRTVCQRLKVGRERFLERQKAKQN